MHYTNEYGMCEDPECEACSPYCSTCEHCGEIDCCGIERFLNNHVQDKTNCKHEQHIIKEIIEMYNYAKDNNLY